MSAAARVIVHVDLDAFFAAVEQRDNPALKGRPVVVGADPKAGLGRGVVSTCSYEARTYGIHSAMPISQAYRLCPQAVFLPVRGSHYRAVSDRVFMAFESFTDRIEPVSIDEAFLDMTGSWRLFGSPTAAGRRLKERILEETRLTASVGIAPVKMAAKIASDLCKPDGLLEIRPEQLREFLAALPIGRLWGVGPKTGAALEAMGVRTVGDLAARRREDLLRHFGEQGLHLHDLANGIDPRAVEESGIVKSVSHEHTFETDTDDAGEIRRVLLQLSEKVSRRMRREGLKGKTLTVKIRLQGFETFTRAKTFEPATNFADTIYRTSRKIFEQFPRRGKPVRLIGVRMSGFDNLYVREGLFTDEGEDRLEQVHRAVDLIQDRFGEDAIHRAS